MSQSDHFFTLETSVASVRAAQSLDEIGAVLEEATRALDFDHFALIQRFGAGNAAGPIQLTNYPVSWIETMLRRQYFLHDPVLAACEKTVAAFAWDELPNLIQLNKHQERYMLEAREQSLAAGFTVPIHVPGEATGLCSFVAAGGRSLPTEALPAAQYLACFAFEAARRIASSARLKGGGRIRLTNRQLECVVLAAKGKSNWVVGELLGLSQQTVHKYLEDAKRRYNVSSRTELVVRALFDGQLSFSDILC